MEKDDGMRKCYDAVILANGEYPSCGVPLEVLRTANFVACCDGAVNEYVRRGGAPDAIVGDCDSLSAELKVRFEGVVHKVEEQEYNDLSKTVKYLASVGKRTIAIVGATGKREDHTLGNISLLMEYMRWGMDVCMFTDHGVFQPCSGRTTLSCRPRQQLSVFSFGARNFKAEGLVYPLYDFTNWWQGTLNECTAESVTIDADGEFLVFMNY